MTFSPVQHLVVIMCFVIGVPNVFVVVTLFRIRFEENRSHTVNVGLLNQWDDFPAHWYNADERFLFAKLDEVTMIIHRIIISPAKQEGRARSFQMRFLRILSRPCNLDMQTINICGSQGWKLKYLYRSVLWSLESNTQHLNMYTER